MNSSEYFKDEPLSLEVEFLEEHPSPQVRLYTNLLSTADEWSEIEFGRNPSGHFPYRFRRPGAGSFCLRSSILRTVEKHGIGTGSLFQKSSWTLPAPKTSGCIRWFPTFPAISETGPVHWIISLISDSTRCTCFRDGDGFFPKAPIRRRIFSASTPSFLNPADSRGGP